MTRSLLVAGLMLSACAKTPPIETPYAQAQIPLDSSYSSSGSTGSGYSTSDMGGKGLSVPQRGAHTDPTKLVVRPDLFKLAFAVREVRQTPTLAVEAAKGLSERVSGELIKTLGQDASVQMRGLSLSKLMRDDKPLGFTASVDGVLRVRLAPNQDFWARSRLYTAVVEATQAVVRSFHSDQDPMRAVSFEPPQAVMEDPESQRAELVKRWVARVRDFSTAAQSEHARLVIRDCQPPGAVVQNPISVDEVSLELAIACRIDTPNSSGVRAPDVQDDTGR